jgi:hypothetical protein
MTALHGRDALLKGLVPRLVGLGYDRHRRDRLVGIEHARPPVVRLVGSRCSGKTAVLQALSDAYSQRIPQAHADLAAPGFGAPGLAGIQDDAPNASRVTDLLYFLSYQLGLDVRAFGKPLRFPRLIHGLLAITSWQTGGPDGRPGGASPSELLTAEERLGKLLEGFQADRQARHDRARRSIQAVAQNLGAVVGLPSGVDAAVRAIIEVVTPELFSPHVHRGARKWWGQREIRPGGDWLPQLSALANDFRAMGDRRVRAERHLVAALLADLADYYGWFRNANGFPRPLVLLDNTHSPLGEEFLELLLGAQNEAARAGRPALLVVVTTALGEERAHRSLDTVASASGWREPGAEAAEPEDRLLQLGLTPLGVEQIEDMIGNDTSPAGLARLILRLSAGRAGVAHALVLAGGRLRTNGEMSVEQLLDLPATAQPKPIVAEHLLERVLPNRRARQRLVFYSPALDDAAAHHLSHHFPPGDPGGVPVQEARDYLRQNSWSHHSWPGTDGPFVGDGTLRSLLLHSLSTSQNTQTWESIHLWLRSHYDPHGRGAGSADHGLGYLHHSLAVGDSDVVVRTLHRRFIEGDAGAWLEAVNLICAAPHPRVRTPRSPVDLTPCPACPAEEHPVHQAIDLLVQSLWRQSAPLAVPDEQTIEKIELQLSILAQLSRPTAQEIFFRARQVWPKRLRQWAQAPDLPIPEGSRV